MSFPGPKRTLIALVFALSAPIAVMAQPGKQSDLAARLFDAVSKDDDKLVQELLSAGADPNAKGHRILTSAAERGKSIIVKALLTAGADVNAQDAWDDTALKQAVEFRQREVVKTLLAAGAEVNARDDFGKTPLFNAAHHNDLELLEILVDAGADINARNKEGRTALLQAAIDDDSQAVKFLKEHGGGTESSGEALVYAAATGDAAAVRELLSNGAAFDVPVGEGLTPLMAAAKNGWASIVQLLIAAGAQIDAVDRNHETALIHACTTYGTAIDRKLAAALVLIRNGADVKIRNGGGGTALLAATTAFDSPELVEMLIKAGADVNS